MTLRLRLRCTNKSNLALRSSGFLFRRPSALRQLSSCSSLLNFSFNLFSSLCNLGSLHASNQLSAAGTAVDRHSFGASVVRLGHQAAGPQATP
jgi:hypothetical protein